MMLTISLTVCLCLSVCLSVCPSVCPSIRPSICLSVHLSVCRLKDVHKNAVFSKTKQFIAMDNICLHGYFKEPILGLLG